MLAARSLARSFLARPVIPAFTRKYSEIIKPVRTRKKKSDLPETIVNASGLSAAPLGDWQGGLKGRSKQSKSERKVSADDPPKKTRTSRKRKVAVEETDEETANAASFKPQTDLSIEIHRNLERFPHCLLLTRVGQFYESYFEQAEEIARLLNIKLTAKPWGGKKVAMCGFPLNHLERHLKVLIHNHQRSVALCEEFKLGDRQFERRVTRVLTPGTLIDEAFLNPYENNFVLSIGCSTHSIDIDDPIGLSWMDVSTGEFFSQPTTFSALRDDVVRIEPKEILLSESLKDLKHHPIRMALAEETSSLVTFVKTEMDDNQLTQVNEQANSDDLTLAAPILPTYTPIEQAAISQLTTFLRNNLLEHMPTITKPQRQGTDRRMQIDAHTIKALEIKEGIREGGTTGTLLSAINRTTTTSGSRLLSRWICSPSTSVEEIVTRQNIVSFFHARPHLRTDLLGLLRKIEDTARIVQKFLAGRGSPEDLRDIAEAISLWEMLRERLLLERRMEVVEQGALIEWESMNALLSRMTSFKTLSEQISAAVSTREEESENQDEEEQVHPMNSNSGQKPATIGLYKWSIKPDFSPTLKNLHNKLEELRKEKETLEQQYQAHFLASSLTLKSSPQLGFHIHTRKKDSAKLISNKSFIPLSESGSTKTFFHEPWFKLGVSMSETSDAIAECERLAFHQLREAVTTVSGDLRKNARIIDEIDVTLGFAELAVAMNFVRPTVTDSVEYHVVNGRHPTVELGLWGAGRQFVPNTISLREDAILNVITGPNMAGKSTLLRQAALIAVLAQTGSFVPADSARIGIVDRLFSRVGAKDDLFRDRSTFMVEMLETAEILNRATPRSLVIMDEVGRGTTTSTALAIAFATMHHLYTVNKCRGLFATHFHEIADMLGFDEATGKATGLFKNIAFFCTDIDETSNDTFTYSHRLKLGVNRNSHGIKVARLGGMPASAIQMATDALQNLLGTDKSSWLGRADELHALGARLVEQHQTKPSTPQ